MFAWCCALGAARRSLTATQLRCLVAMVAGCCALVVASWLLTIRRCALVFNPLRVMVDFLDCFFLLILVFLHLNRIKVGIDAKSFRKMKKKRYFINQFSINVLIIFLRITGSRRFRQLLLDMGNSSYILFPLCPVPVFVHFLLARLSCLERNWAVFEFSMILVGLILLVLSPLESMGDLEWVEGRKWHRMI